MTQIGAEGLFYIFVKLNFRQAVLTDWKGTLNSISCLTPSIEMFTRLKISFMSILFHHGHGFQCYQEATKGKIYVCTAQLQKVQISQECGQISHYFICISLSKKSKISLQMAKFPGNDIPKFPIFLSHGCMVYGCNFKKKLR